MTSEQASFMTFLFSCVSQPAPEPRFVVFLDPSASLTRFRSRWGPTVRACFLGALPMVGSRFSGGSEGFHFPSPFPSVRRPSDAGITAYACVPLTGVSVGLVLVPRPACLLPVAYIPPIILASPCFLVLYPPFRVG